MRKVGWTVDYMIGGKRQRVSPRENLTGFTVPRRPRRPAPLRNRRTGRR
jgi:hypothetical protein